MTGKRTRLPAEDRRQQILGVAMELFARQGYVGTTTRQISEHAGVNEAIIFRHFPRKEDLYWAILEQECRRSGGPCELEARLNSGASDREVFSSVASDILRRNFKNNTVFRLLLFSGLEHHELSQRLFETYISRYHRLLGERIRLRIAEGRFRRVDPVLAARSFLGMVVHYFLVEELFARRRLDDAAARRVGRAMARIWLDGMQSQNGMASVHPRNGQTARRAAAVAAAAVSVPGNGQPLNSISKRRR